MSSNFFSLGSSVLSGLQSVEDDDDLLDRPKPTTTTKTASVQPEPVLKLATGVGREQPSASQDVRRVEKALGRTGFLDMRQTHGPTGLVGSRLDDGVRRFQKQNNLKVDGFLKPRGETARALGSTLAQQARQPARRTTLQHRLARNLDADTDRRRAGLPVLRHASASQNTRTLNALRRNTNLGLVPKLIADVPRARDPEGLTEVDDMFVQATVDDEPLARRLKTAVNGELSKQGNQERIRFRDLPSLRRLAHDFDDDEDSGDFEDGDPGISDAAGDRPDNPPPKLGDDVPRGDVEENDPGISDPAGDRPDNPLLPPERAEPKKDRCKAIRQTVKEIDDDIRISNEVLGSIDIRLADRRARLAELETPSGSDIPSPPVTRRVPTPPTTGGRVPGGGLAAFAAILGAIVSGKRHGDAVSDDSHKRILRQTQAALLHREISDLEKEREEAVSKTARLKAALDQASSRLANCEAQSGDNPSRQ